MAVREPGGIPVPIAGGLAVVNERVLEAIREVNTRNTLHRQARTMGVLKHIAARRNRIVVITRHTGWHERSVQRYVADLIQQGLVCWDTRHMTGSRIFKLTEQGRARLKA